MITTRLSGTSMQSLLCQLSAGQMMYGEPGKFLWKTQNVNLETRLSSPATAGAPAQRSGLLGKALDVGKRALAGEHLAFEYFTPVGGNGLVCFAGVVPGEMKVFELDGTGGWIAEKGCFVAAETSVNFDIAFTGLRAGLRGGEGFVLEHFTGEGTLAVAAAGNFIELNPAKYGGTLQVHTGCIVCFQDHLSYDVARIGGLGVQTVMNAAFGDGTMVATISGDGVVLVQTVTIQTLALTLEQHMRGQGSEKKTGLGGLGNLGDLF